MSGGPTSKRIVRPRGRFLRSAQLERDFRDPKALTGYVATPSAFEHLRRIASGLRPESGDRAFRILGAYGCGKSTFALLLAHWLRGDLRKLPEHLRDDLLYSRFGLSKPPRLHPLLVTGRREPLPEVLRRAIVADMGSCPPRRGRPRELERLLGQDALTGPDCLQLVSLYRQRIVEQGKCSGLLLVIDELGKVLEFAAQNPESSDVFVWQLLAEEAARQSSSQFVIVGILHEGFSSYAHLLGITQEREWEKVAGRYTELPFRHSLDQTVRILSAALNVDRQQLPSGVSMTLKKQMKSACAQGWYGANANSTDLEQQAPGLFPLDAYVLPVLDRFLHQYAQNERSVFSFLFGGEPGGLMDHLGKTDALFSLDHLFDYVKTNFDHILSDRPEANIWVMIKSLVAAAETGTGTIDRVLKAVAILNLLNSSDLLPTTDVLANAIRGATKGDTKRNLVILQSEEGKRVLFDRGAAGGLCLWPHVSVDLHAAYDEASRQLGAVDDSVEFVRTYVGDQHLVARRHYIKTGSLRYFRVLYCTVPELETMSGKCNKRGKADGVLLVPLLRSEKEHEKAMMLAMQFREQPECVVAIPSRAINSLSGIIHEALVWEHILTNTPALNNDPYARDTVSLRREREKTRLEDAIHGVVGLGRFFGQSKSCLVWQGKVVPGIESSRQFAVFLSTVFDKVYERAPRIRHELLNRESLSSAAAGARMRLIEGLLERSQEFAFGMDAEKRPPEMSMYLSIFKEGGLHRITKDESSYKLKLPRSDMDDSRLKITPVMKELHTWLKQRSDKRLSVPSVFDFLRAPPRGIKSGLAPLLLCLESVLHDNEIAFYEDGRFVSQLTGAEVQRLLKEPETFEVQFCNIKGVRADAFKQVSELLGVKSQNGSENLLDVVRPLCVFAAELPPYVRKTKRLSSVTLAVRAALLETREPVKLLFTELPAACGVSPIDPGTRSHASVRPLVAGLRKSIAELRSCYYELRQRILAALASHFDGNGNGKWRQSVSDRADTLFKVVGDPKLRAFCFRLADATLPNEEWGESVASLIVSRPPNQWGDGDESRFEFDLGELVGRFFRSEAVAFGTSGSLDAQAVRICLTHANGEERAQVTSATSVQKAHVAKLQQMIENIVADEGAAGLVALSDVLWKKLRE